MLHYALALFEAAQGLSMSDFDTVASPTPWGCWRQTIDEVIVEVNVPKGSRGKDFSVQITPTSLLCRHVASGTEYIHGPLCKHVVAEDSLWTLEDAKLLRIVLIKSIRSAAELWPALLATGQHAAATTTLDKMQKNLTLERFQRENPGMDFSSAEISGNYHKGGPALPN